MDCNVNAAFYGGQQMGRWREIRVIWLIVEMTGVRLVEVNPGICWPDVNFYHGLSAMWSLLESIIP